MGLQLPTSLNWWVSPGFLPSTVKVWNSELRCEVPKAGRPFLVVFLLIGFFWVQKQRGQEFSYWGIVFLLFFWFSSGFFDFWFRKLGKDLKFCRVCLFFSLRRNTGRLIFEWCANSGFWWTLTVWEKWTGCADRTLDVSFGASSRLMNKKWSGTFGRVSSLVSG